MAKIRSARMLYDGWHGQGHVLVTCEGEQDERALFDFYPDEITFFDDELIDLTEDEARALKRRKDTAYLRR